MTLLKSMKFLFAISKAFIGPLLMVVFLMSLFGIGDTRAQATSMIPTNILFLGVGASYGSANFTSQSTYGKGTSYQAASLAGGAITGSAEGATGLNLPIKNQTVPSVQFGFFEHFEDTQWMWGGRLIYSNLSATASKSNQLIPQAGGFNQDGSYIPFTGNYVVRSYEQTINHQFSFIPTFGHSFEKGYFYIGAGPTYSQIKTSINNIIGFADIIGVPTSVTGLQNGSYYSATQWVLGGAALVGATYFLNKEWFLDLSYSAGMTKNSTVNWGGPWQNTPPDGIYREGTNSGTSSGRVITQTMTLTLNKAF